MKVNHLNRETEKEIKVRDEMLHRETKISRQLRSEVVKAKDVLMSDELTIKARNTFKKLVDLTEEDKVLLEDGSIHELLEREMQHRQTFEFAKDGVVQTRKQDKANKRRYLSNEIKFKDLSTIRTSFDKDDLGEKLVDEDGIAMSRMMMGQSVEW